MGDTLPAYRLKIERAKRHIEELARECRAYCDGKPYALFIEDDVASGQRHWKVRVKKCIPAEWGTIIGDIIHNARAALDLLMVAVVQHCDPGRMSHNHVHFVIRESKKEFEAALGKNIKGASPEARKLVESLKPYKGGDEAFYRLHQLDILDKHKALIPVGAARRAVDFQIRLPNEFYEALPAFKEIEVPRLQIEPDDRLFPLENGTIVFSTDIGDRAAVEDEVKIHTEISFGEGQILDGEPLDPALTQIVQFVEGICEIFERNILNK